MKVKELRNIETNKLTGYLLNGTFVPLDPFNRHYQEVQKWIKEGNQVEPAYTEEERLEYFKNKKIKQLKSIRDKLVNEIKITLESGEYLDGNELAQTRMSRAIQALPDDTTTLDWIDTNNNTIQLTKPKFKEALVLAGQKQTGIFTKFNSLREQVNDATSVEEIEKIKFT